MEQPETNKAFSWLLQPLPLLLGLFLVLYLVSRVVACNHTNAVAKGNAQADEKFDSARYYKEQAERTATALIWQDSVNRKDKEKIAELAAQRAAADLRAMQTERESQQLLQNENRKLKDFQDSLKKPHNAYFTAVGAMRDVYREWPGQ